MKLRTLHCGLLIFCVFFMAVYVANAQTVYFQDDFEHGLGKWVVSGKDWDVVTDDYRSTTHSFHDSPGVKYAPNANSVATLANAIDLAKATSPELRFWTKHAIQVLDYWGNITDDGRVDISQDGGLTWKQISEYHGTISSWYHVSLDLSLYKSKPILLRFRLTSDGPGYEYDGWSIDDIEIREANSLPSLGVTIEPSGGGTITGGGIDCPGTCTRSFPYNWINSGKDWGVTASASRSGKYSITDNSGGKYSPYANSVITLAHPLDLSSATSPQLQFWTKHEIQVLDYWGNITDDGRVDISQDGGLTWKQISEYHGTISSWYPVNLDLSLYKSKPILLRFRLTSDGPGYEYDGWYIDDVQVKDVSRSQSYFFDDFEGSSSLPGNVTLTASPAANYALGSWTGCDSITTDNKCVLAYNIGKDVKATFRATTLTPPGAATLVSPSGTITTYNPTYTWNAAASATRYLLYVNDSTGNKINQWYTATEAGCTAGTGTCAVTPSTALADGAGQWWIQTWNSAGNGPWSIPLSFAVSPGGVPGKASPVSPTGNITNSQPAYVWHVVPNATWYQVWVNDSAATAKIKQWYTAAQAGCGSGVGNCSVTPSTTLALGAAQWWVQTWNDAGFGPWSDPLSFAVVTATAPGKATLVFPTGTTTTTTPSYVWNAVPSATWYQLWVNDSNTSSGRIKTWYTAAQAGCTSGTGVCSVTPSASLAIGAAQWWVQTWNEFGYGPWSDGMGFIVSAISGWSYYLTTKTYAPQADWSLAVKQEFGSNAEVVDWNTLKSDFGGSVGAIRGLFDYLGILAYPAGDAPAVTRNGSQIWSGNRSYGVNRLEGVVPAGYLVHDQIQNNWVCLGSWPADRRIMARVPTSK